MNTQGLDGTILLQEQQLGMVQQSGMPMHHLGMQMRQQPHAIVQSVTIVQPQASVQSVMVVSGGTFCSSCGAKNNGAFCPGCGK